MKAILPASRLQYPSDKRTIRAVFKYGVAAATDHHRAKTIRGGGKQTKPLKSESYENINSSNSR